MFLLKVLKHNIWIFLAIALFAIAQLFINYKRGLVVTPFYHYGMYSSIINAEDEYPVFEVEVNGQKLQAKNYTPQQWDNIIMPLTYYSAINKSNALYHTDIKRLLDEYHLSSNEKKFLQTCDINGFTFWYRSYLQSMLHQRINGLNFNTRIFQYKAGHLEPTNSILTLDQACN